MIRQGPPPATRAQGRHEEARTRLEVARFDWAGGESRVHVTFADKGDGRSTVALEHDGPLFGHCSSRHRNTRL